MLRSILPLILQYGVATEDEMALETFDRRYRQEVLVRGSVIQWLPCVGAWVTYGLGSENQNLPGFVVIYDKRGGPFSGPANWSAGFLPAAYQGTVFRATGDPIAPRKVNPEIPPQVEEIILHAMERNPADRYPSAAAMKAELDDPDQVELTVRAHGGVVLLPQRAARTKVGPRTSGGQIPCGQAEPARVASRTMARQTLGTFRR